MTHVARTMNLFEREITRKMTKNVREKRGILLKTTKIAVREKIKSGKEAIGKILKKIPKEKLKQLIKRSQLKEKS